MYSKDELLSGSGIIVFNLWEEAIFGPGDLL